MPGKAPLAAGETLDLTFNLSSADLSAVAGFVMTTTAAESAAAGFVTTFPGATPRPRVSSLNLDAAGQTRANLVTTRVGPNGVVSLFSEHGGHLIADLNATYEYVSGSHDGRYLPLVPTRLFDTRVGSGGVATVKVSSNSTIAVQVLGKAGVPASGVGAVVLNVTVTQPDGTGYVTVFPTGGTPPTASNVNYLAGQDVAGQVIVPVGADGKVHLFTAAAAHLLADVAGYFTDTTVASSDVGLFVPTGPARVLDTRLGLGAIGRVARSRRHPHASIRSASAVSRRRAQRRSSAT